MINDHLLSDCKALSKESNNIILAAKRQELREKNQGVVAADIEKEEVEAENTPNPTHE